MPAATPLLSTVGTADASQLSSEAHSNYILFVVVLVALLIVLGAAVAIDAFVKTRCIEEHREREKKKPLTNKR